MSRPYPLPAALPGLLALALLSVGCATTGAVPRPFPTPAAARRATSTLVGTALDLRGVPYRNGGANPAGFDCSGFTQYVFAQHGLSLPRAVRDQFTFGSSIAMDAVEAGDLLFFATTDSSASHVAIAMGGDEFVHAPSSTGVVRVERLSRYWSSRYVGARRLR